MQLCKYINCFLKSHNKLLNQYFLNFTIFLPKKKKFFKKWFSFGLDRRSGRVGPQKTRLRSRVNPFLLRVKKKKMEFGSGIFQDRPSQKILTRFVMSSCYGLLLVSKKVISVIGLNYN